MRRWLYFSLLVVVTQGCFTSPCRAAEKANSSAPQDKKPPTIIEFLSTRELNKTLIKQNGFFPFYWDKVEGKIWLEIPYFEQEFLYVNYLATGLGSNPVELDRGKLDRSRVVKFVRIGPKVLLVEPSLKFRALTENPAESRAVAESFSQSILWGTQVVATEQNGSAVLVDATDFIIRDSNDTTGILERKEQGKFELDANRSAVYLPRTKNFEENTEFEAILTFKSSAPKAEIIKTTPSPEALSLRQHHSFVRLDSGYAPRRWDPRAGFLSQLFYDYGSPLNQPIQKRYILRHKLRKNEDGKVTKPIVYYVDPGAPEKIQQALIDGASWWNEAFKSAGFKNAFQVKLLPPDKDPLDIQYNVILWVHRNTRGWSYGNSVVDPRTGEILKGVVTLGSLRTRHDRLLFEGLNPYSPNTPSGGPCAFDSGAPITDGLAQLDPAIDPVDLSLMRIKQLVAHEVGHTLGLAHNFAASSAGRTSVMDYPAPEIKIVNGHLDLSDPYGKGVGAWDTFAIKYGYSQFLLDTDENSALEEMVHKAFENKAVFISDIDARSTGAFHPQASLWDNGADSVEALRHEMKVRRIALQRFGEGNLPNGRPMVELEDMFVPLFLHHRYQVEAAVKLIGGAYYRYSVVGKQSEPMVSVDPERQRAAVATLLETLDTSELVIPDRVLSLLHPRPFWDEWNPGNELIPRRTGMMFDPLAAAEIAARLTVSNILQYERAARLIVFHGKDPNSPGLDEVIDQLLDKTWYKESEEEGLTKVVKHVIDRVVLEELVQLAENTKAAPEVRAITTLKLEELMARIPKVSQGKDTLEQAHQSAGLRAIKRLLERSDAPVEKERPVTLPPGSPIGNH